MTSLQDLKDGMGFSKYNGAHTFGALPAHYSQSKTTPRDRTIMRDLFQEGKATRQELALAFGVTVRTVDRYI